MTDTIAGTPPETPKPQKPASIRSGSPKEIAIAACKRQANSYGSECFASYLKSLADEQSSMYQKKRPRQETLNQQMDMLDAMFTYLAVHADWKNESPLSYSAALRAQKQFCFTLREIKNLKLPPRPTASPTYPLGAIYWCARGDELGRLRSGKNRPTVSKVRNHG